MATKKLRMPLASQIKPFSAIWASVIFDDADVALLFVHSDDRYDAVLLQDIISEYYYNDDITQEEFFRLTEIISHIPPNVVILKGGW